MGTLFGCFHLSSSQFFGGSEKARDVVIPGLCPASCFLLYITLDNPGLSISSCLWVRAIYSANSFQFSISMVTFVSSIVCRMIFFTHSLEREGYKALQSKDPIPIFLVFVPTFSFAISMVAIISSVDAMALFSAFSAIVLMIGAEMADRMLFGAAVVWHTGLIGGPFSSSPSLGGL